MGEEQVETEGEVGEAIDSGNSLMVDDSGSRSLDKRTFGGAVAKQDLTH